VIVREDGKMIRIDLFDIDVYLIDNEEELHWWAEQNWPDEKHERDAFADLWDTSHGVSMGQEVRGEIFYVLMIKNKRHGTVCHEAVHMSGQIMRHKGIPQCVETDEVRAYMTDYIFRAACKHVGLTLEGHE
jgi:hypothetical protein